MMKNPLEYLTRERENGYHVGVRHYRAGSAHQRILAALNTFLSEVSRMGEKIMKVILQFDTLSIEGGRLYGSTERELARPIFVNIPRPKEGRVVVIIPVSPQHDAPNFGGVTWNGFELLCNNGKYWLDENLADYFYVIPDDVKVEMALIKAITPETGVTVLTGSPATRRHLRVRGLFFCLILSSGVKRRICLKKRADPSLRSGGQ